MLKNLKYKILLQKHKNHIYNFSYLMLRNRMDAEEATQDVLLALWRNLDKINPVSAKAWLYKTAHNRCIDYIRKRKVFYTRELLVSSTNQGEEFVDNNCFYQPDVIFDQRTNEENIFSAIHELPENQRNVLILFAFNELKYREISKVLGMPINSVKVNLLRARQNLIVTLKKKAQNDL